MSDGEVFPVPETWAKKAHMNAAAYDAERTADLFCKVCNFCLPSYLEAEKRVRELGWIEEPAAPSNGVDPTSPVAAESP